MWRGIVIMQDIITVIIWYDILLLPPPPPSQNKLLRIITLLKNACEDDQPFSRPVISTESRDGGMFSTAVTQSSPAFFTFLYSTRKDWMGKPRLPRGIQVTYADVSVAVDTVGLSGASGAAVEEEWCQMKDNRHELTDNTVQFQQKAKTHHIPHLLRAHPSVIERKERLRRVSQKENS